MISQLKASLVAVLVVVACSGSVDPLERTAILAWIDLSASEEVLSFCPSVADPGGAQQAFMVELAEDYDLTSREADDVMSKSVERCASLFGEAEGAGTAVEEPEPSPLAALPSQSPAFAAQVERTVSVLAGYGYDTNIGGPGSANTESRVLIPVAAGDDLAQVFLSLQWGTDIAFGDTETTGERDLGDFILNEVEVAGIVNEVWFMCHKMLIFLRADLSDQEFDSLAANLHRDSCQ